MASAHAALTTVLAGRSAKVLVRTRNAVGDWRHLEVQASPWLDEDGDVAEVHSISRDVTDRVYAERAQREAERRLELALEHAPIGMALLDLDGRWVRVNEALCRLVGYTREELLSKTFQDITHPDDLASDLAHLQKLIDGEIDDYAMDKRYVRANGSPVWAHLTVTLLRDDNDQPVQFIAQIQDITERQMMLESLHDTVAKLTVANDALREADDMKDHILAVVSHELRSPLTSIIGFSDLLATRFSELDGARRQEVLGKISEQGHRLRLLVEDLLTVSAIRSGQLDINVEPFLVEPVVRQVVAAQAHAATVVCPDDVYALGDPRRVSQILVNLLTNAAKYGAPPVKVVVSRFDEVVELCVIDEGLGVAPEFVPKLFENFTQASIGDRRVAQGIGLGLAIVRDLAVAQGGRAWYAPNEPTGSRFCFSLPAAAAPRPR